MFWGCLQDLEFRASGLGFANAVPSPLTRTPGQNGDSPETPKNAFIRKYALSPKVLGNSRVTNVPSKKK